MAGSIGALDLVHTGVPKCTFVRRLCWLTGDALMLCASACRQSYSGLLGHSSIIDTELIPLHKLNGKELNIFKNRINKKHSMV